LLKVYLATAYPGEERLPIALKVTRALLESHRALESPKHELEMLVSSRYPESLQELKGVLVEFGISGELIHSPVAQEVIDNSRVPHREEIKVNKRAVAHYLNEHSGWDYVLFSDADTWVDLKCIDDMRKHFGTPPDCDPTAFGKNVLRLLSPLRNSRQLPGNHSLAVYFHHSELAHRVRYGDGIGGDGGVDNQIHAYMVRAGCFIDMFRSVPVKHYATLTQYSMYTAGQPSVVLGED
jgi:hypothetical protein